MDGSFADAGLLLGNGVILGSYCVHSCVIGFRIGFAGGFLKKGVFFALPLEAGFKGIVAGIKCFVKISTGDAGPKANIMSIAAGGEAGGEWVNDFSNFDFSFRPTTSVGRSFVVWIGLERGSSRTGNR